MWTRSSVHATDSLVFAGEWDGTVTAFDRDALEPRWSVDHPEHAVGLETLRDSVVVAGRGDTGTIAAYDLESGEKRWSYGTADDVGESSRESIFYQPYVVALETGSVRNTENAAGSGSGSALYAAARRYERDGEHREWHSAVYAFDADGAVRWRYETDASPISIDLDDAGERLAVGYNRCMGEHDNGLVVLETESGTLEWSWDPGTEGDRRVGDVSFDGDRIAVSSHGDKRGYLLGPGGAELWRVDLATETEIDGETLYAYPNHAYANDGRVAFVTGNTYAVDSRETDGRHPNEHRIAAFDADGQALWDHGVGGFVHGLAAAGDTVVAPCAQNFRVRDPDTHGVRSFSLADGERAFEPLAGIATAATVRDETVGVIEEPVEYHDEGATRGTYALRVDSLE
ncbi:PQQ enzyme repeat-containing protein [Halostagnicola kamekurae]|uniref:PQQ enzyme repeat-containing protein n=2 Tax=Halostagnicola kamekurae TaxID=619731 RepID=A0A1I6SGA0_9EURY|nr:PQQ enzyme repeat-containing protein [Halostagnicola kamekurae]